MDITSEQRAAWLSNPETFRWEAEIGPLYKSEDGTIDIERLFAVAELNGLRDARQKYSHLNNGQIAMNIRNRLRPLWLTGKFKRV